MNGPLPSGVPGVADVLVQEVLQRPLEYTEVYEDV